jgi:hypothetical protein
MTAIRKRIGAVAVAVTIAGTAAPVSAASAATTPLKFPSFNPTAFPQLPAWPSGAGGLSAWPSGSSGGLSFAGPSVGGISTAIGPTVITVGAGNIFTNTTITTNGSAGAVGVGVGP